MAEVYCQNCGAKVVLPEHSCEVTGTTISKESKGTFVIPTENNKGANGMKPNKMDQATLNAIKMAMGDEAFNNMMSKMGNDTMITHIAESGDLECGVDFHRWVLKQMLELKAYNRSYTSGVNRFSYMYQFEDTVNKLKKIISLYKKGKMKAYEEELMFFNLEMVSALCDDYLKKLKVQISSLKTKNCKGIPYYEFKGRQSLNEKNCDRKADYQVFVADIQRKVINPLEKIIASIKLEVRSRNAEGVMRRLRELMRHTYFLNLRDGTAKCKEWMELYKGYGAYFSLKDSVRFFGVRITDYKTGRQLSREESLHYVNNILAHDGAYIGHNYRILALMEKSWEDCKFNLTSYREALRNRV